jgi:hypothetical protein
MELLSWLMGTFIDGPIVLSYSNKQNRAFVNKLVNFLGVGLALYFVAALYDLSGNSDPIIKHMVKCKYCRKKISSRVRIALLNIPACRAVCTGSFDSNFPTGEALHQLHKLARWKRGQAS